MDVLLILFSFLYFYCYVFFLLGFISLSGLIFFVRFFAGLCPRNMGIKGVGRNAEKSLKIYINIIRRQRKGKLEDKMGRTTDSLGNLRLSMETPAIRFQSPKHTLLEQVFVFVLQPTLVLIRRIKSSFTLIKSFVIAIASLTPLNSILCRRMTMI